MGPVSCKVLQTTNTLAYLVIFKLQRKWSVLNTTPREVFGTLHFHCNLWLGPISCSVTWHLPGEASRRPTLKLTWSILKLWRKWSIVNKTTKAVFRTLHFDHNFQMGPNKLECYRLGWKVLQATNTLAYWANQKFTKRIKGCEYDGSWVSTHNTSFSL